LLAERRPDARERPWYRGHLHRDTRSDLWDTFRVKIAARVPDRRPDDKQDRNGGRTRGILDLGDLGTMPLISKKDGPADGVDMPGKTKYISHHVETHAAAVMRDTGAARAVLYVNKLVCEGRWYSCFEALPDMLPEGARLMIYSPRGKKREYIGLPDPVEGSP
jgi:hypothetical protein